MATVLIVDDDRALREGLSETISDLGHRPIAAHSGREALARMSADHIDAVLLDLRMPGDVDGIEFLRRIREQRDCPPVVVLTAFASSENTIEAMRLGAFAERKDVGIARAFHRNPRLLRTLWSVQAKRCVACRK